MAVLTLSNKAALRILAVLGASFARGSLLKLAQICLASIFAALPAPPAPRRSAPASLVARRLARRTAETRPQRPSRIAPVVVELLPFSLHKRAKTLAVRAISEASAIVAIERARTRVAFPVAFSGRAF